MADLIDILPLSRLRESDTNPRKAFDPQSLQELADSISSQGLLQPIVVRPVLEINSEDYEIVFGHRRFRAAQLAGLGEIPCIVRAMTDAEVSVAQIHENLERVDVSPIEEADAYARLIAQHAMSADQIAADTGKSRTYIYNRLKLATLSQSARQQVLELQIPAEVATLVARVPAALQGKAIERICVRDYEAGTLKPMSYRQARTTLSAHFTRTIWLEPEYGSDTPSCAVPWDPADATLTTCGACTTCPKMSANDPGLLEALGAYVCTDVPCFAAKTEAHEGRRLDALRREGRLIDGDAADAIASIRPGIPPRGYRFTTSIGYPLPHEVARPAIAITATLSRMLTDLQAAGQAVPTTLHIEHHGEHVECLSESDAGSWLIPDWRTLKGLPASSLLAATSAAAAPAANRGEGVGAAQQHAQEGEEDDSEATWMGLSNRAERATWSAQEQATADGTKWADTRLQILKRVATSQRTMDDLRLMAHRELTLCTSFHTPALLLGWITQDDIDADDAHDLVVQHIDTLASADDLAAYIMMVYIDDDTGVVYNQATAARRAALAIRYGVDPLAPAGPGTQQMDEAGPAGQAHGDDPERDPNTADIFEGAGAA